MDLPRIPKASATKLITHVYNKIECLSLSVVSTFDPNIIFATYSHTLELSTFMVGYRLARK
jgi:hypothetical protein